MHESNATKINITVSDESLFSIDSKWLALENRTGMGISAVHCTVFEHSRDCLQGGYPGRSIDRSEWLFFSSIRACAGAQP
jgi:hypothetical protein